MAAFEEEWDRGGRSVVVVEASDLARVMRLSQLRQRRALPRASSPGLGRCRPAGGSPRRGRPRADAVLLPRLPPRSRRTASPSSGSRNREQGDGSVRPRRSGPASSPWSTSRRPCSTCSTSNGRRAWRKGRRGGRRRRRLADRVDHLVQVDAAPRFRENLLVPTTLAVVLVLALVVAALVVGLAGGRGRGGAPSSPSSRWPISPRCRRRTWPGRSLLEDLGLGFYWSFVVGVAVAVAAAAWWLGRRSRRPWLALVAVLAVDVAILVGDVVTGSRLHLSAAFGYSPTGNSSALRHQQLLLRPALGRRLPPGRGADVAPAGPGRHRAMALMVGVLVVLGVPTWGSDVGGIIAFTPTVLVFAALLTGLRPKVRSSLLVAATVAAVIAFGLVDLARPAPERAHLGRLFERVGDEGVGPLFSIVQRKFAANLRVTTSSFWVAAVPIAVGTWAFLRWWRGGSTMTLLHERIPSLHAAGRRRRGRCARQPGQRLRCHRRRRRRPRGSRRRSSTWRCAPPADRAGASRRPRIVTRPPSVSSACSASAGGRLRRLRRLAARRGGSSASSRDDTQRVEARGGRRRR